MEAATFGVTCLTAVAGRAVGATDAATWASRDEKDRVLAGP